MVHSSYSTRVNVNALKKKTFFFCLRGSKIEANRRVDAAAYIWHYMIQKLERFLKINTLNQIQKIEACVVPYTNGSVNPTACFCFSSAHKEKTSLNFSMVKPRRKGQEVRGTPFIGLFMRFFTTPCSVVSCQRRRENFFMSGREVYEKINLDKEASEI